MPEATFESAAAAEAGLLEVAERFAIVPEWLLDADVSDTAIRLYAVLLRYGQSSGARMPGRATLARRLRKKSVDTIDRAMRELVSIGAVSIEHRYAGGRRLTNRYHLNAHPPADTTSPTAAGSRTAAATPDENDQVEHGIQRGGGRTHAAGVAADVRHDPQHFTHTTTSPQPPDTAAPPDPAMPFEAAGNAWRGEEDRFLDRLGITDPETFVAEVAALRRDTGGPSARWARPSLVAALQAAVKARGWPAEHAAAALRIVAADPTTRSPLRLAEAGPWWDHAATTATSSTRRLHLEHGSVDADTGDIPLAQVEADLAETDGLRVHLQAQARAQLVAEGRPMTRATVLRRAHHLLHQHRHRQATAC
jgi:hypothetical protein